MDIVKPVLRQQGFGYIEVLIALILFALTALGLTQVNLDQARAVQKLSSQLAAQQLLLTIHNRLELNRAYLKAQKDKSLYFVPRPLESECQVEQLSQCNRQFCNDEQLAQQDLFELDCLAMEAGVNYLLTLNSAALVDELLEVAVSIWLVAAAGSKSESAIEQNILL